MRKQIWIVSSFLAAAVAAGVSLYPAARKTNSSAMAATTAFRILLGVGGKAPANWDGSIAASSGKILDIRGYRFGAGDSTDSLSSWKAATRVSPGRKGKAGPVLENGVIVTASDDAASFTVKTAQGSFSFRAAELPFGEEKSFLDGKALVERSPNVVQLTSSTEEQDHPAIAQSGDTVYVAYVEFVHSDRSKEIKTFDVAPKNFDFLARPAGGDQIFLMTYSKSKRTWSEPVAVSAPKQDVMRAAVAVDGQKRVWVFWSANKEGNFDIYAKSLAGGRWSGEMRLTSDPGTDVNPVAATDAKGRVWVAWQGFRNHNLEILAAAQNGDKFTKEAIVSFSKASDWDPAIAAAPNGEVAVSWDTYDKGDYDVYFRHLTSDGAVHMDAPIPVAASQNFEARSSIAYDAQSRLWVAYEASGSKWGKDFGAYEQTGIKLYLDHTARVKCFQGSQAFTTVANLAETLPATSTGKGGKAVKARKAKSDRLVKEDGGPLTSFPRIAADPNGFVYLTYRTRTPGLSPLGSVWIQSVVFFDGANWKGPIGVPETDNYLDVRAAMLPIAPGDLMLVASTDHRQSSPRIKKKQQTALESDYAINTDLVAAEFRFNAASSGAKLKALPAEKVAAPDKDVKPERDQIAQMRNYRVALGSDKLQIMRGEFHRHTEISSDGGGDGPVIDAYRYLIDAASMDWGGCCDHDNGNGREYSWWIEQKLTDAYHLGTNYVPMFNYERSVRYPEGHRNPVMAQRGVRPLPRLPKMDNDSAPTPAPDTQMLYRYLRQFNAIVASHTSGTDMGTDWRDNDPVVEPVVEIYQGDRQNYEMPGAPRSNTADYSIGGWRPAGFVSLALKKGYRLGFQASSDHTSVHMSYCNLWVTSPTRQGIMEAFHKRRVYGSTDNILADVRCGEHFMGEEFKTSQPPAISVKLWGADNFAKVHVVKDGEYVYSIEPKTKNVAFVWRDEAAQKGKTSYYYVRGEQTDGELVWVSPMWITYE